MERSTSPSADAGRSRPRAAAELQVVEPVRQRPASLVLGGELAVRQERGKLETQTGPRAGRRESPRAARGLRHRPASAAQAVGEVLRTMPTRSRRGPEPGCRGSLGLEAGCSSTQSATSRGAAPAAHRQPQESGGAVPGLYLIITFRIVPVLAGG